MYSAFAILITTLMISPFVLIAENRKLVDCCSSFGKTKILNKPVPAQGTPRLDHDAKR
jgi:hypothetical protein